MRKSKKLDGGVTMSVDSASTREMGSRVSFFKSLRTNG